MFVTTINEQDAAELCQRPEDHFFDHKAFAIKPAKIQKISVAFANADGGEFIIGIADAKEEPDPCKRWQGMPNIEDFNQHIQALQEITPNLPFSI